MMLECVPNVSEGRDDVLIEELAGTLQGTELKNIHSDPDHNRTVFTVFGEPEPLERAMFSLAERAMQILDVKSHEGVHPLIGVVDVIPFIPFMGAEMSDAVKSARALGKRLWEELKLPVYYYGEAAGKKERKDLPYVRKGGYAALSREIGREERRPDEGKELHATAGAVAVGARKLLIAFNVDLATNDLDIARSIAQNIRESHGGIPGVRALGLELKSRGITQVSINIVDHKRTYLKQVYEEVQKWVREYNTAIIDTEVVGMLPREAYYANMESDLRIRNFSPSLVI